MRALRTSVLIIGLGVLFAFAPGDATGLGHQRYCGPTQSVVLQVCHPKTCCKIDVPVCIPCCCQGPPCVRFEHTLLGHGRTVFSWPCGTCVSVRYTCCGGIRVSQTN